MTVILPRPFGDHVTRMAIAGGHSLLKLPYNPRDLEVRACGCTLPLL